MFRSIWIGLIVAILTSACSFTQKVKTGQQAYEVKQYSVAAKLFEKEYDVTENRADKGRLAFFAGECYRYLNDHGSAGNWYLNAYEDGFGEQALEAYANSLKQQERYQEALKAYEDLSKLAPGNAAYRGYITVTKQAMEWSRKPNTGIKVEPVSFNSTAADYSPHPVGPGQIIFTSDRGSKQSSDTYLWTGRSFSDLFITNSFSSQVAEYDASINSPQNEGTAVISPDGNALVFTRCFADEAYDHWCKLMISIRKGNSWSDPVLLPFVKEKMNYGHPAFAANGSTLFFSSDAPEGQGGDDIYFTQPDAGGGWSEPVNLGSLINTIGDEQYPTVYNDTLYYSSNHLPGLGGLDIFKTYLDNSGRWVAPINLRAPLNSGADDFGYVVDTFAKTDSDVLLQGFFTTSRDGAGRNDDIYSFKMMMTTPVIASADTIEEEKESGPVINHQVFIAVRVMEPEYEIKDDPNSKVIKYKPLPNGPVILSSGALDQRFVTDNIGQILLKLEWEKNYSVTARYRDHLASTIQVTTAGLEKNDDNPITTINETIILNPIFKNKEIVLENIFYDYDKWFIREDAKPSLDYLSNIMKTNPSIRIQLSSHTDCRGTDEYNLDLSQKRAQAAIDYLMTVGIPSSRLTAQGFGESNPSVICDCDSCTEEQHQKNRRTTFKILD